MTDRDRSPDPQLLTTYRYLRMALITVLTMLFVAVLIDVVRAGWPPLTSISAYYWSPVGPVFIASLVALGVGMVVIKGDNEIEDICLNLGGVLAPVVAFVPIPRPGTREFADQAQTCRRLPPSAVDTVSNNIPALLVAGAFACVLFLLLRGRRTVEVSPRIKWARRVGFAIIPLLLIGAVVWFNVARTSFECRVHGAAAIPLFIAIIAVTALNAVARYLETRRSTWDWPAALNAYTVIAVLMVTTGVGGTLAGLNGWSHAVLFVEAAVIVLFVVFWAIQSRELWDRAVRHPDQGLSLWPRG